MMMVIRDAGLKFVHQRFHALTHKNFRYFWVGQCFSLIGTWVQNIGQSWLVLTLTGSPFLLGLVGMMQFLPVTLFSLFAGVIIDKFPKKTILYVTQTVSMILAFILSFLVFSHTIQYGHILVLAFLLGVTNTFDMTTRQTFNIEIVGKEDLMNAIALNSATFNLARVVGPSIGALMMAYMGAAWCFLLNGLSFLPVIYSLMRIKAEPYVREKKKDVGVFREIKDGIVYMSKDPLLAQTILLVAIVGTMVYNFNVLIPVFTKEVLHLQEKTYGVLMSCIGAGSLAGALVMSMKSRGGPRLIISSLSSITTAIFLCLLGMTGNPYLAGLLLVLIGAANILFQTNSNSTLQLHAKDEYRARVMSVYSLVFVGSTPIGNLITGYIANQFGAGGAFVLCGIFTLVPSLIIIFGFRKKRAAAGISTDDRIGV
jgi:predicted MFS family arabinose efflux permease